MNHKYIPLFISILVYTGIFCQEPIPNQKGFEGFLLPEVGIANSSSNIMSSYFGIPIGKSKINSINNTPNSATHVCVKFPFRLGYIFRENKTYLFAGNSNEDFYRFDFTHQFAFRQRFKANGFLQFGITINSFGYKTWEDPYITNRERTETYMYQPGIKVEWIQIKGTGARLSYTFMKQKIGNELSGNEIDLPMQHLGSLDRTGSIHKSEFCYLHSINDNNSIQPVLSYSFYNLDGTAVQHHNYLMAIIYNYQKNNFLLLTRLGYYTNSYNTTNPVYNEKEQGNGFLFNFRIHYVNPWNIVLWGDQPLKIGLSGNTNYYLPNIDFYKSYSLALKIFFLKEW